MKLHNNYTQDIQMLCPKRYSKTEESWVARNHHTSSDGFSPIQHSVLPQTAARGANSENVKNRACIYNGISPNFLLRGLPEPTGTYRSRSKSNTEKKGCYILQSIIKKEPQQREEGIQNDDGETHSTGANPLVSSSAKTHWKLQNNDSTLQRQHTQC